MKWQSESIYSVMNMLQLKHLSAPCTAFLSLLLLIISLSTPWSGSSNENFSTTISLWETKTTTSPSSATAVVSWSDLCSNNPDSAICAKVLRAQGLMIASLICTIIGFFVLAVPLFYYPTTKTRAKVVYYSPIVIFGLSAALSVMAWSLWLSESQGNDFQYREGIYVAFFATLALIAATTCSYFYPILLVATPDDAASALEVRNDTEQFKESSV